MRSFFSKVARFVKPRRRWFQFSLRTLMLLILLAALGLSWLKLQMIEAQGRHEAVSAIRRLGGEVFYDYQCKQDGHKLWPSPPPPEQTWLRSLLGADFFDRAANVSFYRGSGRPEIGDADLMSHLERLGDLRVIWLPATSITNEGLGALRNHNRLRVLHLGSAKINEGDLDHLKGLQLERLYLRRTRASDAGVRSLQKMTSLRILGLARTKVTDAGLRYLEGLCNLQVLNLRRTHVSRKGAEQLQKKLPNCTVLWEPLIVRASTSEPLPVPEGFRNFTIMLPMYRHNTRFSPGDHVDVFLPMKDPCKNEVILKDVVVRSGMLACGSFHVNSLDRGAIQVDVLITPDDAAMLMAATNVDSLPEARRNISRDGIRIQGQK